MENINILNIFLSIYKTYSYLQGYVLQNIILTTKLMGVAGSDTTMEGTAR